MARKDPRYAPGYVALLHRIPGGGPPGHLMDLEQDEYHQVGSLLPLEEYFTPFEIYKQFAEPVPDFGLNRGLRAFDAIDIAGKDGKRLTLVLIEQADIERFSHVAMPVMQSPDLPLGLAARPRPFSSKFSWT